MSNQDLDDDLTDWVPPTDAELKVIDARRDRSNKISHLMGQYLLKGHKMLASSCRICNCVLLEDQSRKIYCIGCNEVDDSESRKDNPAVSEEAARKTVEESQHRLGSSSGRDKDSEYTIPSNILTSGFIAPVSQSAMCCNTLEEVVQSGIHIDDPNVSDLSNKHYHSTTPTIKLKQSANVIGNHQCRLQIHGIDVQNEVCATVDALRNKLSWATVQLNGSKGIAESRQLAALISEVATGLSSLKSLMVTS